MPVSESSAECFNSESFQSLAASQRQRVLAYVKRKGAATRREIAADLQLERGDVSRAVCELMNEKKYGKDLTPLVELDGLHACPITKRPVTWVCCREDAAGHQMGLAV